MKNMASDDFVIAKARSMIEKSSIELSARVPCVVNVFHKWYAIKNVCLLDDMVCFAINLSAENFKPKPLNLNTMRCLLNLL